MPAPLDVRALLDPEIAAALSAIPFDLGQLSAAALPAIRAGFAAMPPVPLSDQVERTDHAIPGRPGVSVRVHRPKKAASRPRPCIYWMHGGGLILGTNKADPVVLRAMLTLARDLNMHTIVEGVESEQQAQMAKKYRLKLE